MAASDRWIRFQTKYCQTFLSDPSPIIGNACHSLTDSLTHSCLVNLIDVTLACEDAKSKVVDVVTVADVDDEDRVGNSLLQIWKLRLVINFCSDFEHFGQDFYVEVQARF